jgi:hypothetical protein
VDLRTEKIRETEVASCVVAGLRADGWDVYQEVRMGYANAVHDIVAVRPGIFWIIECKTTLSLDVIGQAASAWYATLRSVAVPERARRPYERPPFAYRVCEKFGVGVIRVCPGAKWDLPVNVVVAPKYQRIGEVGKHQWDGLLCDEQRDWCVAGTHGGGYWTPWKDTMRSVVKHVVAHPGCTIKEIVGEHGPAHYASNGGFANGIRFAIKNNLLKGVRLDADGPAWRLYPVPVVGAAEEE